MAEVVGTMVKLTSSNYSIWKARMEDLLYCKDSYEPISGTKPAATDEAAWKTANRKTVALIRQWVDDSVFHHVSTETDAHALWKKLESLYERKTAQNKAFLIRKLVNIKYIEGSSVTEHLSNFPDVINRLAAMKMALDDEMQALLLLSSLPDSWETLVVSLSNSAPNGVVTLSMVKESVLNEETRRKEQDVSMQSGALVVEERGRNRSKNSSHEPRGRSKSLRKYVECFYCHKKGHYKSECRALKRNEQRGRGEEREASTTALVSDGDVIVACDDNFSTFACQDSTWVIDSGASFHCTSQRNVFESYKKGDFGIARMGNDRKVEVIGMGDVSLKTEIGCKLVLKNVRHVPKIRLNIISAGALDDDGYRNCFGNGKWKLCKDSLVVVKGEKVSNLYVMTSALCKKNQNMVASGSTNLQRVRSDHKGKMDVGILAKHNPPCANDFRKMSKTMQERISALHKKDSVQTAGQQDGSLHPRCAQPDVKEYSCRKVSFVETHADGFKPAMKSGVGDTSFA